MRYRVSYLMDEIWERAVETAIGGQTDNHSVKNLTLDGAVKCVHGRLPPPSLFEKFPNLEHLSLANIGVSSLEQFPKLSGLEKLILSDNRIASGLEYLVEAGLDSLRDLDLSNNRISDIDDLEPLARLRIVSLDLYECPVTRVKDYRARVFGLIRSLKYLDKTDAEENEREESDDEESEEEEEEMEEEDDPGSGEVDGDGEDRPFRVVENGQNGSDAVGGRLHGVGGDGIVDVDEDEESDADEEETEIVARNGDTHGLQSNGFQVLNAAGMEGEDDDDDDDEENYSGEEIDEEDGEDDEVVEVHDIDDSEDDDDGVEEFDEDEDDDEDEDEEEVDNEERDLAQPEGVGRMASTEGEIDGHEQGEDEADEDDNGETGEEEDQGVEEEEDFEYEEDGEDEEEDFGEGYLVQPVGQADEDGGGSDMDPGNEEEEEDPEGEEEVENEDNQHDQIQMQPPSSSCFKRKRDDNDDDDDDDGGGEGDGDGDGDGDEDDDVVDYQTSSRKRV